MPYLEFIPCEGVPWHILASKDKESAQKQKYNAYFLVLAQPPLEAVIYYMYVKPKHRKEGYGSFILQRLMQEFNSVKTQVSASSKESIDFLTKKGFKEEKGWLVWKKSSKPGKKSVGETSSFSPNARPEEISSSK